MMVPKQVPDQILLYLGYPVISMNDEFTHAGSKNKLLGKNVSTANIRTIFFRITSE
jgi:hypothetical protein